MIYRDDQPSVIAKAPHWMLVFVGLVLNMEASKTNEEPDFILLQFHAESVIIKTRPFEIQEHTCLELIDQMAS